MDLFPRNWTISSQLDLHHRLGDKGLVPIRPHARCEFCSRHFYTHEQLFAHMRAEHAYCFLCFEAHRENAFFKDLVCLYNHFLAEHHVCRSERCMKDGIFSGETVFNSEIQLEHHRRMAHNDHNGRGLGEAGPRLALEEWVGGCVGGGTCAVGGIWRGGV